MTTTDQWPTSLEQCDIRARLAAGDLRRRKWPKAERRALFLVQPMFTKMVAALRRGAVSLVGRDRVLPGALRRYACAHAHAMPRADVGRDPSLAMVAAVHAAASIAAGWGRPPDSGEAFWSDCSPFRSACRSSRSPPAAALQAGSAHRPARTRKIRISSMPAAISEASRVGVLPDRDRARAVRRPDPVLVVRILSPDRADRACGVLLWRSPDKL